MNLAQEGKLKALQAAMSKIEKDFGKGSIMKLGDEQVENVEVIPTGSIGLDAALGVGGYPKGRIIEIYVLSRRVRQHLLFMLLPSRRSVVVLLPSLMQSMLSTVSMQPSLVWMSTICGFLSPTMASRLLR